MALDFIDWLLDQRDGANDELAMLARRHGASTYRQLRRAVSEQ